MIFVYFRQSLVEESLYVRLNNHFASLLHTWKISYAGVQEGGEEGFRVQPDGGRRVGAWQIHFGNDNSCCFLFISMISFDNQVNSMFLADIYGTKEGEEEKDDRQTLQVDYN